MSLQRHLFGNAEGGTVTHDGIAQHGDELAVREGVDLPGQRPLGVAVHASAFINAAAELDDAWDIRQGGITNIQALIRIGKRRAHRHLEKALICLHLWWPDAIPSREIGLANGGRRARGKARASFQSS